ncbi:hypothetical protein AN8424.2 [Aspergillus nidulans FGSC A4]|uniref:DUF2264 domain-containing protein n=1 Tax=Emericella nidulans (strain FGSC A4 / ATCC 38163 / CBS 112.46 / NRRL 194 / M139) TaxID=227321 RepID=Q5ATF6_EMENI|nr:hypothetical protein [Aspergillus nidulans FGSC A4]EAA67046.1 hypothetical protein AN8424.2 [Aspergillus nidulans FGSC A4]CBF80518.1 TPA: conserved hypothetical protein [Aspergillus nidulans FGSC A4]|eukprot:XP_681693.1 hypothetical protein AN8424.2 [Aspergillus nidulans FGSC A4]
MPPLSGFSDNAFTTRSDLVCAAKSLLSALESYKSPFKARIRLSVATAAGFDETAAQLEGFARPLWVVPFLLEDRCETLDLQSWVDGLRAGVDPKSSEYWGDLGDFDQRMVEMESIAVALLARPDAFLDKLNDVHRKNLITWLRQMNRHKIPQNNWLWFRVFVNLALIRSLGVPRDELQDEITAALNTLDTFNIGQGWSSDGLWDDGRKQADYYSGSFAIQFAQLLYVRFAGEEDQPRAKRYCQSAKDFGSVFWRYFDPDGAAIPFGRSMTYRFAFAAFWSAAACAGVQLDEPVSSLGAIKGLLLRHLRWWSKQPHIFNVDGTLNIGYTYPNMYMAENYNSPQSVYWCLKAFIVLMLPEAHPFWKTPELPHPSASKTEPSPRQVELLWPPRHILVNSPEHHFLLSSGQMTKKGHKAREAKYGKLAYSSAFAFSVPCGMLLEQTAPDSTLAVSFDGGESWRVRDAPVQERALDVHCSTGQKDGTVPGLFSVWQPWRYIEMRVSTVLVPLGEVYPGWHVRVHRIQGTSEQRGLSEDIQLVDSGFAISSETASGGFITAAQPNSQTFEGRYSEPGSCLIISRAGASGIADLTANTQFLVSSSGKEMVYVQSRVFCFRPDPNTNLIASRGFLPSVRHDLPLSSLGNSREIWLVSGVFAVAASAGLGHESVRDMWMKRPKLFIRAAGDDLDISVT